MFFVCSVGSIRFRLFGQEFIKVEELAGDHGPFGEFGGVEGCHGRTPDLKQGGRVIDMGPKKRTETTLRLGEDRLSRGSSDRLRTVWARKSSRASGVGAAWRARSASLRAASTNCGSFIVTRACKGVFDLGRRIQTTSRDGASKVSMLAGGAARFHKV